MRLLFCSRPAYGHLYPMMPLALAARDAGHEIAFATGGRFAGMLRAAGFTVADVGISMEEGLRQLAGPDATAVPTGEDGRPDLEFAARVFIEALGARSAADLAPQFDELAPDLVVYEQGELGAAVAAGAAGIPAVCHAISPRTAIDAIASASREPLARLWNQHGVTVPPFDAFTGEVYLDVVPASLQQPAFLRDPARLAVRPTPWAEPGAALPAWLDARARPAASASAGQDAADARPRPLVYLTLGTVVGRAGTLAPAIEALGRLDADVLVALGSAAADGALGPLPDNVRVEAFVDQPRVIAQADLVVHHGGTGTVLGALAHGRRQLLLPKGADQFLNADALRRMGMATVLEPGEAVGEAIEAAARVALDAPAPPAVLAGRDEIAAMPSPAAAFDALLARVRDRPARPWRQPAEVG